MLDYYSQFPAPSYSDCVLDITNHISKNPEKYKYILLESHKNVFTEHVRIFIEKIPKNELGSYTGWYVSKKFEYAKKFMDYYKGVKKKFKKLKNVILFIGKLIVLQKKIIQKLYYEIECSKKHSNVLKTTLSNRNNNLTSFLKFLKSFVINIFSFLNITNLNLFNRNTNHQK